MPNLLRIIISILILNLFSACGFQPIYKNDITRGGINYENELAAIKISGDKKRIDQKLKVNLQEILNPNKLEIEKEYNLTIKISKKTVGTFINDTGSAGRNKVILNANYKLSRIADDEIIASGNATAKDDFDVKEKRFADYITEESIELNLTKLIAQNIRDLIINDLISNELSD
jgi:hypothetical protein